MLQEVGLYDVRTFSEKRRVLLAVELSGSDSRFRGVGGVGGVGVANQL